MTRVSDDRGQPEVMTSTEAADFLRMSRAHLVTRAKAGNIPGHLVDRTWRFLRSELHEWVRSHDTEGNRRQDGDGH